MALVPVGLVLVVVLEVPTDLARAGLVPAVPVRAPVAQLGLVELVEALAEALVDLQPDRVGPGMGLVEVRATLVLAWLAALLALLALLALAGLAALAARALAARVRCRRNQLGNPSDKARCTR